MTRRLVPRAEVADQPGYGYATERWLVRLNAERRLPFHKVGGRVLIDLDDLDAFAERGRVEAATGLRLIGRRGRSRPA